MLRFRKTRDDCDDLKTNQVKTKLLNDQTIMTFTISTTTWMIKTNHKETYICHGHMKGNKLISFTSSISTKLMEIWANWKKSFHVFFVDFGNAVAYLTNSVAIYLKKVNNTNTNMCNLLIVNNKEASGSIPNFEQVNADRISLANPSLYWLT